MSQGMACSGCKPMQNSKKASSSLSRTYMTYRMNNCINTVLELVGHPLNVHVGQLANILLLFSLIKSNFSQVGGHIKAEIDTGHLPNSLILKVSVNLFTTGLKVLELICKSQPVTLEINIVRQWI